MSQREYGDFVDDIVNACRSLINFVKGITFNDYIGDEKTRYAVERVFQIMGEGVKHLPEELKMENPQIPWSTMTALRNRIVHGYFSLDDTVLFETIELELKPLLPPLEELARKYAN